MRAGHAVAEIWQSSSSSVTYARCCLKGGEKDVSYQATARGWTNGPWETPVPDPLSRYTRSRTASAAETANDKISSVSQALRGLQAIALASKGFARHELTRRPPNVSEQQLSTLSGEAPSVHDRTGSAVILSVDIRERIPPRTHGSGTSTLRLLTNSAGVVLRRDAGIQTRGGDVSQRGCGEHDHAEARHVERLAARNDFMEEKRRKKVDECWDGKVRPVRRWSLHCYERVLSGRLMISLGLNSSKNQLVTTDRRRRANFKYKCSGHKRGPS